MKHLLLFTIVLLLIVYGPATQNTGENTEAEEASQEEQAESSSEYVVPSEEDIREDIPGRALEQIQDVLSKGEPYINEKVKGLTPSPENIEPIVKQEGFENLEQAK